MIFVLFVLSDSTSLRSNTRPGGTLPQSWRECSSVQTACTAGSRVFVWMHWRDASALQSLLPASQGQVSSLRLRKRGCSSKDRQQKWHGLEGKKPNKTNRRTKKGAVVLQGCQKTYFPTGRDELVDFTASTHNFIATERISKVIFCSCNR